MCSHTKICDWFGYATLFGQLGEPISAVFPIRSQRHQKTLVPTTSRLEISVGMTFCTYCTKQYSSTLAKISYVCFKSYEFKRAINTCGKFKITETQNENSQKSNKFSTSAQEEMQIELVFVKDPKLQQIFGRIRLGVKISKLWQIFGKIDLGKSYIPAKFRRNFLKFN